MKVLVACTGNSCRSQLAEGLLKELKPDWKLCSGGTQAASKVATAAIEVLNENGIDISENQTNNLDEYNISEFDYCIAFSEDAKYYLEDKTETITYYEVDDPLFSGAKTREEELDVYRNVRDRILNYLREFIKQKGSNENS